MPRGNPDDEDRSVLYRAAPPPDRAWDYGPGSEQVADIYLPRAAPERSTLVVIHGGFWRPEYDRVHVRPLAAHLAGRGHQVVVPEYRRVPGSPDLAVADLRLAIARLAEESWAQPDAIQAIGHSAGGHLVLVLAGDEGTALQSGLALAPVADLEQAEALNLDGDAVRAFLGNAASTRPDLDPVRRGAPSVPVATVHGQDDSIVPIGLSERYVDACLEGDHRRLIALAETGHFEVIDPLAAAMAAVESALDALAEERPGLG